MTELYFCEDIRDLDKQLQCLKIKAYTEASSPISDRSDESIIFTYMDEYVDKYHKIEEYVEFRRSLDLKSRDVIDVCLEALTKKNKIYANMVKPLKIIPFHLWIKQLLGDCLRNVPEDRPNISQVQKSLNIAGCLRLFNK